MESFKLEEVIIDNYGCCSFEKEGSNLNEEVLENYLSSSSITDLACLTGCCGCNNIC